MHALLIMATSTREELVSKPGTKSILWDYFGLRKTAKGEIIDDGRAVSRVCRKNYTAKNGNTSNLLSHLHHHHAKLHAEVTQAMKKGGHKRPTV